MGEEKETDIGSIKFSRKSACPMFRKFSKKSACPMFRSGFEPYDKELDMGYKSVWVRNENFDTS